MNSVLAILGMFIGQGIISTAQSNANEFLKNAEEKANETIAAVDTSRSSASELYNEGREVAGQAASDKAGLAKKEAKAASAMAGGSKLFNALQGAAAATEATQEGFDNTVNNAAALAANQENAEKQAALSAATSQAANTMTAGANKANTAISAGNASAGNWNKLSSLGSNTSTVISANKKGE